MSSYDKIHRCLKQLGIHRPLIYLTMTGFFLLTMASISCQTAPHGDKPVTDNESLRLTEQSPGAHYNQMGDLYYAKGMAAKAIGYWRIAIEQSKNPPNLSLHTHILLKMARAYVSMGQTTQALQKVDAALDMATQIRNTPLEISALNLKGSIFLSVGKVLEAQSVLEKSLQRAHHENNHKALAEAYIHVGNLHVYQNQYEKAQKAYDKGIAIYRRSPGSDLALATALTNSAMASIQNARFEQAKAAADEAIAAIGKGENHHDKIFVLINIGLVFQRLRPHLPALDPILLEQSHQTFLQAFEQADQLGDIQAGSYALGYLGQLYEDQNRLEEALQLTRRAAIAARKVDAKEALFRWQWQIGRIYRKQNQLKSAITAYRLSVLALKSIQQAQSGCYGRFQSTLRQDVTAVSLELADLLLQHASSSITDPATRQSLLSEAREVVELNKVYELRDYYQDDCVDAAHVNITRLDTVSPKAVVVYPLLFSDRYELLVGTSTGLKQYQAKVTDTEVIEVVRQFRRLLEKRTTQEYLPLSQKLYNWFIRPIETDLKQSGVDTLVFIPGGALRTIPMAALHDGSQFLIEKYAIAITPGLYLTDPQTIGGKDVLILAAGLTESVQGFPSLPFVADELRAIQNEYPTTLMVNEEFSVSGIETALEDEKYTIVHIASHAQFGENIDNTFLLTFDEKFSFDSLDQSVGLLKYREDPLELLTLSACETAAGDDRAALGLAGVAVKSGARSALATLWHVNDLASSILIGQFYQELHGAGNSRAAALQKAQQKLLADLRYQHPGYWAPYLLINNWL